jgi:hypothetical protein
MPWEKQSQFAEAGMLAAYFRCHGDAGGIYSQARDRTFRSHHL